MEEILASGTKVVASETLTPLKKLTRTGLDRLKVSFTDCFKSNTSAIFEQCSKVKNIIYRNAPVSLLEKYVAVNFESEAGEVSDVLLLQRLQNRKKTVVSGFAGYGKTMFVKWATLNFIESIASHGMRPLYLELRYISKEEAALPFDKVLYSRLKPEKQKPTYEQFRIALNEGLFACVLDAVDEVNPLFRSEVIRSIQSFIDQYPECGILISTRPDEQVESINSVDVFHTLPMTQQQIVEVIRKLDYVEDVKAKLIAQLEGGLFEKQKSFLVSPLLATIMLLTFDNSASIPLKTSLFYKEAFETLYYRHDSHKGAFKRGHNAGLPIDEFENVFSHFCYSTLQSISLEFSYADLIRHFRASVEYCGLTVEAKDVLDDAIDSASLLHRDGAVYTFAHRSFQEYFSARFILNYVGDDRWRLIENFAFVSLGSGVLKLLFEMNRDFLEANWILRKAEEWLKEVDRVQPETKTGLRRIFQSTYSSLGLTPEGRVRHYGMMISMSGCNWMSPLEDIYPDRTFSRRIFANRFKSLKQIRSALKKNAVKSKNFETFEKKLQTLENRGVDLSIDPPDVRPKDSDWLIYSGLPQVMIELREEVRDLAMTIKARVKRISIVLPPQG